MKIAIFLGSRPGNNPAFGRKIGELCEELAKRKLKIVYGGGNIGLMGLLAETANFYKIPIIGVIPAFLVERELLYPHLTETIIVQSLSERKEKMIEIADAFLVFPGGIGTIDEFFEVLTYHQLGLHSKHIGILNTLDYYQPLKIFLLEMIKNGFLDREIFDSLMFDSSIPLILDKLIEKTFSTS